jgi:hypothetical protein
MFTVPMPPDVNPIAVKYIVSYHIKNISYLAVRYVMIETICTVLLGQSNLRYNGHVVMMVKTCHIHNPAGKSLGISRLESLRILQLDNIAIGFSEELVTDVDGVTRDLCH